MPALRCILFTLMALPTLILGTSGSVVAAEAEPIQLFVSILPQQYLVQQIGAEHVSVQTLVEPGADPHTYEPKPGQMADLTKARLYFSIGMPFEEVWLPKIIATNPELKVVAIDQGITKLPMDAHGHAHAHASDHAEASLDPHVWLAPHLLKTMAQTICTTLSEAEPEHAPRFAENYRKFAAHMDELDRQIRSLLAGTQGTRFIAFHPSWGYFAKTYELIQIPIEIEGKEPKASQLRELIRKARELKIMVIFAQPQFSSRSAELIAKEIGGRVIPADPLAADVPANLLRQAQAFQGALR